MSRRRAGRSGGGPDETPRAPGAPFVDVAFNLPIEPLTYRAHPEQPSPVGSRVVAPLGRRSLSGLVVRETDAAPPSVELKTISRVVEGEPLFSSDYLALADWVRRMYLCSLGEALSAMVPGARREVDLPSFATDETPPAVADLALSDEQSVALESIFGGGRRLVYLYGITGSGKTEVFLQAAERTIAEGRSVIYLVPEIALTHQLLESVRDRFARVGGAAVLHSRLTPSQRLTEWRRIGRGEVRLVIGARSAVFAPVRSLGLVVLDEEHDGSYKSGSAPRYHARQVAMKRVADAGARMVMGSATPSVEAWHLMAEGTLHRVDLTRRLAGGAVPTLEIVDLRLDEGPLSGRLLEALRRTREEGRQSILFLNRRGFAHYFTCRTCGYEMTCRHCSVGLTLHKERNLMVCHYCGYRTRPTTQCPDCGSYDVGYAGFGTERIDEELRTRFPDWRIARVDTDAVRRRGALEQLVGDFRSGKIDVLLGTQMVAKGLNFPGVKLVGIVLADTGLHLPDFRAAERTFSLIVQVAGRAGRFHPDGHVIIQSYATRNPAIARAQLLQMDEFYHDELAARRELGFPPFSRLVRLVLRGRSGTDVGRAIADLGRLVAGRVEGIAEVLGPSECPISVMSGSVRHQLIIRTRSFARAHGALAAAIAAFRVPSGCHLEVDVDPVSLL